MGVVFTNPFINNISSGMHLSEYASEFGTHNYDCFIMFSSSNSSESILIAWQEVLDGKKNGIQVWRSGEAYRDIYSNFIDHSKTTHGLTWLMNILYPEVYGDRLQCLNLINCFNRANVKNQGKTIREYEGVI